MALLREVTLKELEPDVISYSAAISSCEKSELWEKALALLREMPSKWLEPNVVSYSATISSCEKSQLWAAWRKLGWCWTSLVFSMGAPGPHVVLGVTPLRRDPCARGFGLVAPGPCSIEHGLQVDLPKRL